MQKRHLWIGLAAVAAVAQANLAAADLNQTINCANVESAQRALDRAIDGYDDYVTEGYTMDATFAPDPDSAAGETLRTAQSSFDVAQAGSHQRDERARGHRADGTAGAHLLLVPRHADGQGQTCCTAAATGRT